MLRSEGGRQYIDTQSSSLPSINSSSEAPTSLVLDYKAVPPPLLDYKIPPPCDNITANVAFIKTHKTGSTTLRSIINRFGLSKNLSFVYLSESRNGHVRYTKLTDKLRKRFLPPLGVRLGDHNNYRGYNMSTLHIRFSRKFFDSFMEKGTKYVTILRDPVDQWLSVITYFNMKKYLPRSRVKSSLENVAKQLAVDADKYRSKMGASNYYFFQNNQAYDLGLSVKNSRNSTAISNYIHYLGEQFDLVLINEYFDESLILLRKMLCWSWSDIIYISRNQQSRTHSVKNETLKTLIRRNNAADQYLYDFFNKTLWKKIAEYGANFHKDLKIFRTLLNETKEECLLKKIVKRGRVYNELGKNKSSLCMELIANDQIERIYHKQRQQKIDNEKKKMAQEIPSITEKEKNDITNQDIHLTIEDVRYIAQRKINSTGILRERQHMVGSLRTNNEPLKVREAREACEKDPACKKIESIKQPNGKIKIVRYLNKSKKS